MSSASSDCGILEHQPGVEVKVHGLCAGRFHNKSGTEFGSAIMLVYSKKQWINFVPIVGAVLLLQACGSVSSPAKSGEIFIESEPSGASVHAMGKRLGSTPVIVSHQDVFPVTYDPGQENLYGDLLLRKDGCQDYRQRVNSAILRKGAQVKLDCAELTTKPSSTQASQDKQPDIAAPIPATLKQRLMRLNELHQDGLITDEEYAAARRRILEEL
jgi:hypothetical protein